MANPVITVQRAPAGVVAPGTQLTFNVVAVDADARSVTYRFPGVDSAGNEAVAIETVVVSDPVTVSAEVDDPAGTATAPVQDLGNPALWHSTV